MKAHKYLGAELRVTNGVIRIKYHDGVETFIASYTKKAPEVLVQEALQAIREYVESNKALDAALEIAIQLDSTP